MPSRSSSPAPSQRASSPGSDLRHRVEALGTGLAESLSQVLAHLPRRAVGPQIVANMLGITTVTASRLLKALGQSDPVATLQLVPGPNPLKRIVEAAREAGVDEQHCQPAWAAIESFDSLIRNEAGDRGALKAMLSAWLPQERREFEAQRRQSIFKAMAELDGVSSELELNAIILHAGSNAEKLDIANIKCLLGVDRIRPDAVVQLGTRRVANPAAAESDRPRGPVNLDGESALEGMHTVRLDEFCKAPPAPLEANDFGPYVRYSLGPTGFGPASKVDLVIAEVNRNELNSRRPSKEQPPYFFTIPEMASRKAVFDLLVHRDVYAGRGPTLLAYDTSGRGPAAAADPERKLDQRHVAETVDVLGSGLQRARLLEFPRYLDLLRHSFEKLGWESDEFRAYRIAISYPLVGTQITLAFLEPDFSAS
ncbi:MAG: hypothetical protein GY711_15830 [bacterium]|nr:hypothetical protein [bacterium]